MDEQTPTVEKVTRGGKVAVIVSPGFGAGWSTWSNHSQAAAFAPDVVAWIEDGKPDDGRPEKFEKYGYTGGLFDCEVEWLPAGTHFEIEEYDGAERLRILASTHGYTA